jgi:hypothetical protein
LACPDSVGAGHFFPAAHSGIGFDPSLPTAEENGLLEDDLELLPQEVELLKDDLDISELESSSFDF